MKRTGINALALGSIISLHAWAADEAQKILSKLHHSNQYEIELGKIAREKAVSRRILDYAEELIKDHIDSDSQIQEFAGKKQITLLEPSTAGFLNHLEAAEEQQMVVALSKKTGADFDKAFAEDMIQIHKLDKIRLENAENILKQEDIRNLVAVNLKTAENHLQGARDLEGPD
jgi:putative membrane protein